MRYFGKLIPTSVSESSLPTKSFKRLRVTRLRTATLYSLMPGTPTLESTEIAPYLGSQIVSCGEGSARGPRFRAEFLRDRRRLEAYARG